MLSTNAQVLGPAELAVIAEGTYRLLGDEEQAKRLVEGVDQPDLQTDLVSLEDDLEPFDRRFRINRLLYALDSRYSPSEIVPTRDIRETTTWFSLSGIFALWHIFGRRLGLGR